MIGKFELLKPESYYLQNIGKKIIITDKRLANYNEEYYILWESKPFYHLSKDRDQLSPCTYIGKSQCKIINYGN